MNNGDVGLKSFVDVVIVGAGPYGTSLALNLKAAGVSFKIFGKPMETWREHMPIGMELKSEGNASNMSDPHGYSLERYCRDRHIPYEHVGHAVQLSTFCEYGLTCYDRIGDAADPRNVVSMSVEPGGYRLVLSDGSEVRAHKVIVAVGIAHFAHLPEPFSALPRELVSHGSQNRDLSAYQGKELVVVGAGASATDIATLAAEAGAKVTMVSRGSIKWTVQRVEPRPVLERLRYPDSCISPGLRSCLYERSPLGFRTLPPEARYKFATTFAGPAGGWSMRDRFEKSVTSMSGTEVTSLKEQGGRLALQLTDEGGAVKKMVVDHLIAATGYKANIAKIPFLSPDLQSKIASLRGAPVLSRYFESTLPSVYFVGNASAMTFGPLMRFVCGTPYTAQRLTRHLKAG